MTQEKIAEQIVDAIIICPSHKPLELGYLAWHTEAERRTKRGMKQKECPKCKHWFWKDEM